MHCLSQMWFGWLVWESSETGRASKHRPFSLGPGTYGGPVTYDFLILLSGLKFPLQTDDEIQAEISFWISAALTKPFYFFVFT